CSYQVCYTTIVNKQTQRTATMDLNQATACLREDLGHLNQGDQRFAKSLVHQMDTNGKLSHKQEYWAIKLAEKSTVPPAQPIEIGNINGVIDLFRKAGETLK